MEATESHQDLHAFRAIYIITEAIGFIFVVLVGIWTGTFLGGFAWSSDPKLEFNWHPLLMSIGMIFLYGNSMLLYRSCRTCTKRTLKIGHASIFIAVFFLIVLSLVAVFDSHNLASPPIPNMYSLHSWVGLTAVILFAFQLLAGFTTYLYPGLKSHFRVFYMPYHVYFGIAIFICTAAAALLGISEKAFFSMNDYSQFPVPGILVNVIGILLILFTGLVVFLVTKGNFKRQPLPEDTVLLTSSLN